MHHFQIKQRIEKGTLYMNTCEAQVILVAKMNQSNSIQKVNKQKPILSSTMHLPDRDSCCRSILRKPKYHEKR